MQLKLTYHGCNDEFAYFILHHDSNWTEVKILLSFCDFYKVMGLLFTLFNTAFTIK